MPPPEHDRCYREERRLSRDARESDKSQRDDPEENEFWNSVRSLEILGGKILGVAALSTTVMAVWATLGLTLLNRQAPGMVGAPR